MILFSFQTERASVWASDRVTFPKGDVNSVSVKEEELPLTPPSEGLAAHFSSPGTVLVSSRVTEMHTQTKCRRFKGKQPTVGQEK